MALGHNAAVKLSLFLLFFQFLITKTVNQRGLVSNVQSLSFLTGLVEKEALVLLNYSLASPNFCSVTI